MTIPSEFVLLHNGTEIVMLADLTCDLITNLLISYMVFVSDIQKFPITSHLKDMYSSFLLCCQGPAFMCI